MTNLEKLNQIFCEVYSVEESVLNEKFISFRWWLRLKRHLT